MPLDTSTYSLALLRVDGRRWNELRRLHAQIRTQSASDGSSYLEMGHTKVMCTVTGPSEGHRGGGGTTIVGAGVSGIAAVSGVGNNTAGINVEISMAGFSSVDRKKRLRNDKRLAELSHCLTATFTRVVQTQLFPHSTITLSFTVLSQDGSLLAALFNAATLALVDAGIPLSDYVTACTSGSTSSYTANDETADPLLDLNNQEEQELPFITVATFGASDRVAALMCESRVQISRLEGMLAVGVSGCHQVRTLLDNVIRERGRKLITEGTIRGSDNIEFEATE